MRADTSSLFWLQSLISGVLTFFNLLFTAQNKRMLKSVCFQIAVARSSVDSISWYFSKIIEKVFWSCYVMIGFVMPTNLSQLKITKLRSKNKRTLKHCSCDVYCVNNYPKKCFISLIQPTALALKTNVFQLLSSVYNIHIYNIIELGNQIS